MENYESTPEHTAGGVEKNSSLRARILRRIINKSLPESEVSNEGVDESISFGERIRAFFNIDTEDDQEKKKSAVRDAETLDKLDDDTRTEFYMVVAERFKQAGNTFLSVFRTEDVQIPPTNESMMDDARNDIAEYAVTSESSPEEEVGLSEEYAEDKVFDSKEQERIDIETPPPFSRELFMNYDRQPADINEPIVISTMESPDGTADMHTANKRLAALASVSILGNIVQKRKRTKLERTHNKEIASLQKKVESAQAEPTYSWMKPATEKQQPSNPDQPFIPVESPVEETPKPLTREAREIEDKQFQSPLPEAQVDTVAVVETAKQQLRTESVELETVPISAEAQKIDSKRVDVDVVEVAKVEPKVQLVERPNVGGESIDKPQRPAEVLETVKKELSKEPDVPMDQKVYAKKQDNPLETRQPHEAERQPNLYESKTVSPETSLHTLQKATKTAAGVGGGVLQGLLGHTKRAAASIQQTPNATKAKLSKPVSENIAQPWQVALIVTVIILFILVQL